ncbi:Gfo/Idh/MocA family protein [Candidatus Latescibacterota bacterium]
MNEQQNPPLEENTASNTAYPSVAVIGSGYWGKNLTRNFHELGALKVICDKDFATLAKLNTLYPDVETSSDYFKVLGRDDIQCVVIATPAETHYSMVKDALESGKHVFVEKPFVLREDEGHKLIQIAESKGLTIMVGHVLQYHPAFIKLKEMVDAGELGNLQYIYSHRLNLGKIRNEENILWSFAPHDISLILELAGELPENVHATGGNYLHEKIADVTTTHLEFESGLKAHIFVSWLHPFKEQKLVVVGDKKMAVLDDTLPWAEKLLLYPHEINMDGDVPIPNKADPQNVPIPESEPLKIECRHFLQCVATGQTPKTDAQEGLRVLRILNLSQKSMDNNSQKLGVTVEE